MMKLKKYQKNKWHFIAGWAFQEPTDHDGSKHLRLHPGIDNDNDNDNVDSLNSKLLLRSTSCLCWAAPARGGGDCWCCPGSCSMERAWWSASGHTSTTPPSAGGRRRSVLDTTVLYSSLCLSEGRTLWLLELLTEPKLNYVNLSFEQKCPLSFIFTSFLHFLLEDLKGQWTKSELFLILCAGINVLRACNLACKVVNCKVAFLSVSLQIETRHSEQRSSGEKEIFTLPLSFVNWVWANFDQIAKTEFRQHFAANKP